MTIRFLPLAITATGFRSFAFVLCASTFVQSPAYAEPERTVIGEAGKAANYVGRTFGGTVIAVGKGVGKSADRLTGNVDVPAVRKEIDFTTASALKNLFKFDPKSKQLFDQSYGYAVFDSRKSSFLISLGSGGGVAIVKDSGARTYMRMLTAGVNLGGGIQFFQNVFLFETKRAYENFVSSGWEAGTAANANFGRASLDAQVRFLNGLAIYQLTDTGINLSADITGTKYYQDKALN